MRSFKICEQNTLTRHIFSCLHACFTVSHVTLDQGVTARHTIHVSCACVFDLISTLHFALFVRGVLSAKGPDSSFAEAHKVFSSEPTHIEGEDDDQEDEVEDERDCEECKVESRREVRSITQPNA